MGLLTGQKRRSDVVPTRASADADVVLVFSAATTRADAVTELGVNDLAVFTFDVAELHESSTTSNTLELIKAQLF